jgi:hypothetical protein
VLFNLSPEHGPALANVLRNNHLERSSQSPYSGGGRYRLKQLESMNREAGDSIGERAFAHVLERYEMTSALRLSGDCCATEVI